MILFMKRIHTVLLLCFSFLFLFSCKEEGPQSLDNAQISVKPRTLAISIREVTVGPSAHSETFKLTATNAEWAITDIPDWIMVNPQSGNGDAVVTISITENILTSNRTGVLKIISTEKEWSYSLELVVSQQRARLYARPEVDRVEHDGSAGIIRIAVNSNTDDWDVNVGSSLSWCTAVRNDNVIELTLTPNTDDDSRNGQIEITTEDGTEYITVFQRPAKIISTVESVDFSVQGGSKSIAVSSQAPWTASTSYSWINVIPESGPADSVEVRIEVTPNNTMSSRSGYIYLVLSDKNKIEIPVNQDGISFSVDKTQIIVPIEGSQELVNLRSNTGWHFQDSIPSWITVDPKTGDGDSRIDVKVSANPGIGEREATLNVTPLVLSYPIPIVIKQNGHVFETDSVSLYFSDKAGTSFFNVLSDGCWTVVPSVQWITLDKESGTGNDRVYVSVTENAADTIRTGFIVASVDGKQIKVSVCQRGKYLNVSSDALDFTSKGGSTQISLITNSSWTATASDGWISLSASEGSDDYDLTVTVQDNPTTVKREGSIVISPVGMNPVRITVSQDARYLTVPIDTLQFFFKGGVSDPIAINTDGTTDITTNSEWLTINKESATRFTVTASRNDDGLEREGKVNVSLSDLTGGVLSKEIVVVQAPPYLSVSVDTLSFSYKGGSSDQIIVISDATVDVSTNLEWITVRKESATQYVITASWNELETIRSGPVKVCVTEVPEGILFKEIFVIQDPYDPNNGYKPVDLGLSVMWADRNLGAEAPEEDGEKTKWYIDSYSDGYSSYPVSEYVTAIMGPVWRIPTSDEIQELINNCGWTRSNQNGKDGYWANANSNGIFFSFNSYWSQTLSSNYVQSRSTVYYAIGSRYYCLSVRDEDYGMSTNFYSNSICVRGVRPYDYKEGDIVKTIILSESSLDLNLGDSYIFRPTFECADNNKKIINAPTNYISDHNDICTVDDQGHLTAIAPGQCNIMIKSGSANAVFCPVKVSVPDIALKQDDLSISIGETFTLEVQANKSGSMVDAPNTWFEWSSDNERIATVSSIGEVTALSYGFCKITVKNGNAQSTCRISVREPEQVVEAVDMGVSVMWGSCNVGAVRPDDWGGLYAWGETSIKETYYWDTYKWCSSSSSSLYFTKYCTDSNSGFRDSKTVLEKDDDVAYVKLGTGWRTPSKEEFEELFNNCNATKIGSYDDYYVMLTSKTTGNSIYFPVKSEKYYGYWTNSLDQSGYDYDYGNVCDDAYHVLLKWESNYTYGFSFNIYGDQRSSPNAIRPVFESTVSSLSLNRASIQLATGIICELKANLVYGDKIINRTVNWSSSNNNIATVSSGIVTTHTSGECYIIAEYGSLKDTCVVNVVDNPQIDGHEYVDLGLSVLWATCNVGAYAPEDYGDYYAWGEIETKTDYNWWSYVYSYDSDSTIIKYNTDSKYGTIVDNKTVLDPEDDVAQVKWGGSWRMPTKEEYDELIDNCIWTFTTMNEVTGYLVTSKKPGYTERSIFMPASGYYADDTIYADGLDCNYWSSSLHEIEPNRSWLFYYETDGYGTGRYYRCFGHSVRPVCQ